ncbi:MetQ/NlpA family ABC transporter substrate-binding protein [Clostridium tepidum]|jgi:D-methionine transport system substrate-binding protein|uniref:Lipoprotein n=1 Tax=Clostridium tepidum TaxID=1962263 RepID=A0A1S9I1B4_9CLOT|nr:MetQ/NlpA family ABC transporter substrate-binding protein [Clostridium tepidum]MCR1933488.1 MetQ/NlpA family ABC transporter substrate-binding protein [Clostridium tepidum]MDU6878114.1 MetQ/NlpA family ABC transporter substrate-binding protein [Clostridium botulinum]OOO61756.1 methionine ABC transporter substrate-binding protein [Clostridium tepidum]OOO63982.1 methionine ABC transporter substrate-binding protein [Clostridium tepidum]
MNKKRLLAAVLSIGFTLGVVGCSLKESKETSTEKKTIVVGATPVPAGEILKAAKPVLEKKGYKLEIKEFTDYVTPNTALNDGEIDANFFQHIPYLDKFNEEKKTELEPTSKIFIAPIALYSRKIKNVNELKNGATIAVPNDPTNETRALKLLEKSGVIKLKKGDSLTKTDIIENKKNLKIEEIDAPQVPRILNDIDAAIINTNYAIEAKLNPTKDSILIEDKDSPYVNIIAVRKEDKDKTYIKALSEALTSKEVKEYINKKYKGVLIPTF